MKISIEPTNTAFDVPLELHVHLSIPQRPQHPLPMSGHRPGLDSTIGPEKDKPTVAVPVDASDAEVRNLFIAVAENSPEILRGVWSRLHKLVCADPTVWVYPQGGVYFADDEFVPAHIDKEVLSLAWPEMLQRARQASVARQV